MTELLGSDGSASIATALMMSHHGFRRDLALFARALERAATSQRALAEEWKRFRATLHAHHDAEDHGMFPMLRKEQPQLAAVLDALDADHRRIDPLLDEGGRAFAALPATRHAAADVVARLVALLDAHLATEEASVVPFLRALRAFPPVPSDEVAAMYADGFAWAAHGVADDVCERVFAMLPAAVVSRLPAARAGFAKRCVDVWGSAETAASRTSVPARAHGVERVPASA